MMQPARPKGVAAAAAMLLRVVLVLLLPYPHQAEIFTLSGKGAPYLQLTDPSPNPILWYQSVFALKLASSEAVRINSRGVRFISLAGSRDPMTWTTTVHHRLHLPQPAWAKLPCRPNIGSLCRTTAPLAPETEGNATLPRNPGQHPVHVSSSVFPVPGRKVVVAQYSGGGARIGSGAVQGLAALEQASALLGACSSWTDFSGRSVQLWSLERAGFRGLSKFPWDVSSCNVLDAGVEYVFLPHQWELYVLNDPLSFQLFLVLSLLTVLLVIVLARNLERSFSANPARQPDHPPDPQPQAPDPAAPQQQEVWATVAVTMVLFLILVFASTGAGKAGADQLSWAESIVVRYITAPDRAAFQSLCIYVAYYIARLLTNFAADAWFVKMRLLLAGLPREEQACEQVLKCAAVLVHRTPVNLILGTLGLVAMKLYATAETPYTAGILFLLVTRLTMKAVKYSAPEGTSCPLHDKASPPCKKDWSLEWRCRIEQALLLADLLADAVLVGILGYCGLAVYFSHSPLQTSMYILQGVYGVLVIARVVAQNTQGS